MPHPTTPDFPHVSYIDWRARVEAELKGADFDQRLVTRLLSGLEVQPLYSAEDRAASPGAPGASPFLRGGRSQPAKWEMRQRVELRDPAAANKALLAEQGVTSFTLALADGARPGVHVSREADLQRVLEGVDLDEVSVHLDAGQAGLPAAAWLARRWARADRPRGGFGLDPLSLLADQGQLSATPAAIWGSAVELARWSEERGSDVRSVRIDGAPWHDAGADEVTDLAAMLSGGLAALRAFDRGGLGVERSARQIELSPRLGCEFMLDIARLRALRALWARVVEACGGGEAARRAYVHVSLGARAQTRRDPWVNMLRNTVACFAGAVGGADAITSTPFDAALGQPKALGRRVARNTQHVLAEESQLHGVLDPAGGSWAIEALTEQLCAQAWAVFQRIEGEGGLLAALRSGSIHHHIDATWSARRALVVSRRHPITGVSEFPLLDEPLLAREPGAPLPQLRAAELDGLTRALARPTGVAAALEGELQPIDGGHAARVRPFALRRFAAPFERLRDASDAALADTGARPRAFLALLGALAQHTGRATWTRNLLEAGGIEVVEGPAEADDAAIVEAFVRSGAPVAVLCGPDALYAARAEGLAAALAAHASGAVALAGHPKEQVAALREAGVTHFAFLGCDAVELLEALHGGGEA